MGHFGAFLILSLLGRKNPKLRGMPITFCFYPTRLQATKDRHDVHKICFTCCHPTVARLRPDLTCPYRHRNETHFETTIRISTTSDNHELLFQILRGVVCSSICWHFGGRNTAAAQERRSSCRPKSKGLLSGVECSLQFEIDAWELMVRRRQ